MLAFDRFTADAQDSAARAFEIFQRYGHDQVDVEHLLLAMLEQPDGTVPKILATQSINPELLKQGLDNLLSAAPKGTWDKVGSGGRIAITERVKQLLDQAVEAADLKAELISVEHIFRALQSERDTAVARLLADAGLSQV